MKQELTLLEHLKDLRKTVIKILVTVILFFFVVYQFAPQIAQALLSPLRAKIDGIENAQIVTLGILDEMLTYLQLSFWASVIFSSPIWFFFIWQFISPGLYPKEKKMGLALLFVGFFLFWSGILFGHFIVFPSIFEILFSSNSPLGIIPTLSLKDYITLSIKVLVALGLIFQIPSFTVILHLMGILKRNFLKGIRGYVYVVLAILAALLTPPDVFSQLALLIPLVALIEIGNLAVLIFFTSKKEVL